jgi:hypothetical protein
MKKTILKSKAPAPSVSARLLAFLRCFEGIESKVARLKRLVANDNNQPISAHLADQLADIMAFMAKKRGVSLAVMNAELCLAFGVGCVPRLRDNQFRPALDYVLTYKANRAA